ncbi:MFS transporter [Vibrio mediterranei]|uniref:MFS transporter n=1 Tax=Vibrio mediterranei TaxID=689 RepID=UPI002283FFA9|nr:MFS transporter [Vibrio mediterranei]MCY9856152.1 MFS transporter [Vibrio mediterranei]
MENAKESVFTYQQRWVISSLIIGACLPLMDATILGVAVPSLAKSFSTDVSKLQWVSILYTLIATVTVTVCAWATRKVGAKRLWMWGLIVFTLGSLLAAVSPSIEILLLSRAIQGIGAGIIMTGMQTVLVYSVGKPRLKTAMMIMAVPTVFAPIIGSVLAGYLLEIGDWRWIFYINLPIGLLAIGLAIAKIKHDPPQESTQFDVFGFVYLSSSLLLLIYALSLLANLSKDKDTVVLMLGGTFLLGFVLLVRFIKHTRKEGKSALIRLTPFYVSSFQASIVLLFLASIGFYAGLFALPILFIQGFSQSEWIASLWIGAHGLGVLVFRPYLKSLCERIGIGNTAFFGIVLSTLGTVYLLQHNINDHPIVVATMMFARGAGVGLLTLLAMSHAYQDLAVEQVPDASVLSRISTLLGASIGPALVALLYSFDSDLSKTQIVIVGLAILSLSCIVPVFQLYQLDRQKESLQKNKRL